MERSAAVEAVFQPVNPPTTFEETVERLGTAIRLGLLAPGTRLPAERDLADQLGISRSTLRHALTTLVQSGHLTSQRGRSGGTFVAEDPPLARVSSSKDIREDWRDVLDFRVAIECGAAQLAAERCEGAEKLEPMRELVERMAGADDFEVYRRADIRFHIALAEAADSPRLVREMTEVQSAMSELISLIAHPDEVLTHSNAQHRRLVTCLEKGDERACVALLRDHIRGTEHILAGLMPTLGAPA
jgi:GntR family transcriptional repressor for pyruvate dehydrogenase complex